MAKITCTRRLEFDAGHRVLGHGGKCRHPHGHRYVVEVTCWAEQLNEIDLVIDFGKVKELCGGFIDTYLDHGFLVAERDTEMRAALATIEYAKVFVLATNPTAEGIAKYLLPAFADLLVRYGITVEKVRVWETPNCWSEATYSGAYRG